MTEHYDLIVIGSGAGGGTLAHALAPTGKRILILERGDYLRRARTQNWDATEVWSEHRYRNSGSWTDQDGRGSPPKQHYYVGGNTKVYGAVLFRMRERDFGARAARRRRLAGVAASPTTTSSPTTRARSSCTTSTASASVDPTEPPVERPYPVRRRSATSRGSRSCAADLDRGRACTRSSCRSGS